MSNCLVYQNTNQFGGSVYISGTTCFGDTAAFTLNYGDDICMNIDLPIITCENPSLSGFCEPFSCCLPNNFTAPIGASYVSRMLLLDNKKRILIKDIPQNSWIKMLLEIYQHLYIYHHFLFYIISIVKHHFQY